MFHSIYFPGGPKNIYAILRRSVPLRGLLLRGGRGWERKGREVTGKEGW